nr:MAG TPA: Histone-lysine N-methyltransferase SETDB1 [Caudoviricetes sp.]
MRKEYIYYGSSRIYALYYRSVRTLYINLNFQGHTRIYLLLN